MLIYDLVARRKLFLVTLLVPVLFIASSVLMTNFGKTPKGNALLSIIFPIVSVQVDNLSIIGSALFDNWDESIQFIPVKGSEYRWELDG
jgi:uncharacterized membrane protein